MLSLPFPGHARFAHRSGNGLLLGMTTVHHLPYVLADRGSAFTFFQWHNFIVVLVLL